MAKFFFEILEGRFLGILKFGLVPILCRQILFN